MTAAAVLRRVARIALRRATMTQVERDLEAGLWVPAYWGNRFRVARLLPDRLRTEELGAAVYATLAEARKACGQLNGVADAA
jgi:hypothetical protein